MIFVTVGTHEQQFNRLIEAVDTIKARKIIEDDVFIQIGYSTYIPKYCNYDAFVPYNMMVEYVKNAEIVITHGGPATFILPLQYGKIPIVVPRQKQYDEHVNNHQLDFCRKFSEMRNNIILVDDINKLSGDIMYYNDIVSTLNNNPFNNKKNFVDNFRKIILDLMS